MAANDVQEDYADRRAHARVPLDAPYFVTIQRGDSDMETPALIVDCGRGGLQLALSPVEGETYEWLSHSVVIHGLPQVMDNTGKGCPGMVSWVSAERCGVRFVPPLPVSDEELLEVVGNL